MTRMKGGKKGPRKAKPLPVPLPPAQAEAIRQICLLDPDTYQGSRDHSLILLMLHGLRVAEARQMRVEHLTLTGPDPSMMVRFAKGGVDRRVPLDDIGRRSLVRFLTDAKGDLRQEGWVYHSARDPTKPMNERAVQRMVVKRARQAQIPNPSGVHPHRFRHTFAVGYLERKGNIKALQALLGHSDLSITERYLRLIPDQIDQDARSTGMLSS